MSRPKVTVLTAVRNCERYLRETIACIQAQTFTDWEYIIVDDDSEDETCDLVDGAGQNDPRLRLLRRETSGGPYVAANDGLRIARGDYIVRIDADDLCPPHRIQTQLDFLAKRTEYRACVSYWQACNELGLIPNSVTQIPSNPRVFRWALLLRGPSIHSTACIERAALQEIGGYCELRLSQDYRLWCELTRRDWLGTIPEVLCYVRYHEKRETVQHAAIQVDCAMDILDDHLIALTGEKWSRSELETLRIVGLSLPISVSTGTEMLDRWDRLWQSATDLNQLDRAELAQLSSFRRWKLLRTNARSQPFRALWGLAKLVATNSRFLTLEPRLNT